ncbi:MAG: hypothetical protein OSB26_14240 [Woeseiaceae bacterium]|nr:hypothetical protein [Woeseiaceae bacterium]
MDTMIYDQTRSRDVTATFGYPTDRENAGPEQTTNNTELDSDNRKFPLIILVHGILDNAPGTWPLIWQALASLLLRQVLAVILPILAISKITLGTSAF